MALSTSVAAIAAVGSLLVGGHAAPKITIAAPGHAPAINTHWNYSLRVTVNGKLAAARITEQIRDPIGGLHPVEFGKSTKDITNWAINGTFKDFIIWPASSRGIPLTLKITVKTPSGTAVKSYAVTPRA